MVGDSPAYPHWEEEKHLFGEPFNLAFSGKGGMFCLECGALVDFSNSHQHVDWHKWIDTKMDMLP
jgi:hypothetical protein